MTVITIGSTATIFPLLCSSKIACEHGLDTFPWHPSTPACSILLNPMHYIAFNSMKGIPMSATPFGYNLRTKKILESWLKVSAVPQATEYMPVTVHPAFADIAVGYGGE